MDTNELVRRGERELAEGSQSAGKTLERARRQLLKQRDTEGLEHLLVLASRLDDGRDLTFAIQQSLRLLSPEAEDKPDGPKGVALAEMRQRRVSALLRVIALLGVLLLHGFGALMWVAFLGFSSDYAGTDRQLYEALTFGAATWLVAAVLIAWLWRSGRWPLSLIVPFAWWFPSYLLMIAVVYGWNSPAGGRRAVTAVYATATFEESAQCLDYWHDSHGWRLNNDNVNDCFPTQTAAKKKALIACFNKYERNQSDHEGWPEDNMRGCTWHGLTAVPAQNVASLAFGKVVAVPAAPRAGKRFVLSVGVTRSDSAAKIVHTPLDALFPDVAVTINGENMAIKSVGGPTGLYILNREVYELARTILTDKQFDVWNLIIWDGWSLNQAASLLTITRTTAAEHFEKADDRIVRALGHDAAYRRRLYDRPEYWFFDGKIRVKFTVPKTGEGKRLAIKMTAEQGDTPTATKVVTFTVGP